MRPRGAAYRAGQIGLWTFVVVALLVGGTMIVVGSIGYGCTP